MQLLLHGAECNMGNIFRVSHILQLILQQIIAKYEKGGKYMLILHEATCDSYFVVKWLLKSNVARTILLTNWSELAQYNFTVTE